MKKKRGARVRKPPSRRKFRAHRAQSIQKSPNREVCKAAPRGRLLEVRAKNTPNCKELLGLPRNKTQKNKAMAMLGSARVGSARMIMTVSGALLTRRLPQIAPIAEVLSLRTMLTEGLEKGAEDTSCTTRRACGRTKAQGSFWLND